jgi:subtilisin-like proprotein convertase family protein
MKTNFKVHGILLLAFLLWFLPGEATAVERIHRSFDVPKDLLDPGTVYSLLTVADSFTIDDIDVKLSITHTYDADLNVYLVAPDGTEVKLFTDVGGSGDNFEGTILDQEATTRIVDGYAPFAGRYKPQGDLSVLYGKSTKGTWKLKVTDDSSPDRGTLQSWSLTMGGPFCGAPPEPANPHPPDNAENVPVNTCLSWEVLPPIFRLLAGTGSTGPNPFSLVELQTDPVAELLIGPASYNPGLDFAPNGALYGASSSLRIIDPDDGTYTTVGQINSATQTGILMRSIAFHPNGTLYGVSSDDMVLYAIDPTTAFATKIGPITGGFVWGIDFSPDGTFYGAMFDLVTIDPYTAKVNNVIGDLGAHVCDIDFAPDGFIYAVYYDDKMMYKIDPAAGAGVEQYGPYQTWLWGVASQVITEGPMSLLAQSLQTGATAARSRQPLRVGGAYAPLDVPTNEAESIGQEQALKADLHRLTRAGTHQMVTQRNYPNVEALSTTPGLSVTQSTPLAVLSQSQCPVTYDVYLGTDRNALELIAPGLEQRYYCPRGLESWRLYFWKVVAKNPSGETPGPIWSFQTECPVDLNHDGVVDIQDVYIFIGKWLQSLSQP